MLSLLTETYVLGDSCFLLEYNDIHNFQMRPQYIMADIAEVVIELYKPKITFEIDHNIVQIILTHNDNKDAVRKPVGNGS